MQTIVCIFVNMDKKALAIKRGNRINGLRESKGFSRRGLSKIIGISDTALAKVENGETQSITIDLGKELCKSLDISFNELFEIEAADNDRVIELEKKNKELEGRISKQDEMIELQSKMIKLLEKYNDEHLEEFKKFESMAEFSKNLMAGLPKGVPVEEVLEILQKKSPEFIKKEYPNPSIDSK